MGGNAKGKDLRKKERPWWRYKPRTGEKVNFYPKTRKKG